MKEVPGMTTIGWARIFYGRNRVRTIPDLNVPLLTKVMEHIELHPDEHDQSEWAQSDSPQSECGTVKCFAGHAVAMTMDQGERFTWIRPTPFLDYRATGIQDADGRFADRIVDRARQELGLTIQEAGSLFYSAKSRAELRHMVDALIEAELTRDRRTSTTEGGGRAVDQ